MFCHEILYDVTLCTWHDLLTSCQHIIPLLIPSAMSFFWNKSLIMTGQPFLGQMTSLLFWSWPSLLLWSWPQTLTPSITYHMTLPSWRQKCWTGLFVLYGFPWYGGSPSHRCSPQHGSPPTWTLPPLCITLPLPPPDFPTPNESLDLCPPRIGYRLWFICFISLYPLYLQIFTILGLRPKPLFCGGCCGPLGMRGWFVLFATSPRFSQYKFLIHLLHYCLILDSFSKGI